MSREAFGLAEEQEHRGSRHSHKNRSHQRRSRRSGSGILRLKPAVPRQDAAKAAQHRAFLFAAATLVRRGKHSPRHA